MPEHASPPHVVTVRRAYDPPNANDGRRILVDRLWPRGLSKERADLDDWMRDIAPTAELREWYRHDPDRYAEFRSKYLEELKQPPASDDLRRLRDMLDTQDLTLLTASRAVQISEATVLRELLTVPGRMLPGETPSSPTTARTRR